MVAVVPALDEAAVIGRVVEGLLATGAVHQVVVVDNASSDGTADVARRAGAMVVNEPRRGYGRACWAGVLAAEGADVILLQDGDGSDDPADVPRVLAPVMAGAADLVVGVRGRQGREPGSMTPQQLAGNAVAALFIRLFYSLEVSDLGPLRAIRRSRLLDLQMSEMTYGWSVEMVVKAARAGLRYQEVPVGYRRRVGVSKVGGTLEGSLRAAAAILGVIARCRHWRPAAAPSPDFVGYSPDKRGRDLCGAPSPDFVGYSPDKRVDKRGRDLCGAPSPDFVGYSPDERGRDLHILYIAAKAPRPHVCKTRLGAGIGAERAAMLYGGFLRDLGARFAGFPLPVGWFVPPRAWPEILAVLGPAWAGAPVVTQHGADWTERQRNLFRGARQRREERTVLIASDSPHLSPLVVKAAFAALDQADVVLGPVHDGGYYLLGVRGDHDVLAGVQMSTADVARLIEGRCFELGIRLAHVEPTFDVDEVEDLERLRPLASSRADLAATWAAMP